MKRNRIDRQVNEVDEYEHNEFVFESIFDKVNDDEKQQNSFDVMFY